MKQYTIFNSQQQAVGHLQVEDNVPITVLNQIYPNLVEGHHELTNATFSADQIRILRNQLLQDIDRINPVWYVSLDSEQQQQLQQYRQLLLAVPQQPGFPESVEWPAKPTWL